MSLSYGLSRIRGDETLLEFCSLLFVASYGLSRIRGDETLFNISTILFIFVLRIEPN